MTMRPLRATNNAVSTLASGIDSTSTSFTLATGDGTKFPAAPFIASIGTEIMLIGARSGDNCSSVTRAYEGTTAAAHSTGAVVEHRWTAATLRGVYDMFGMVHIARQVNEVSTNGTSYTSLVTFSGLSIPVNAPILMTGLARKTSGAVSSGQLGFFINSTNFDPVGGSLVTTAVWSSRDTNQVEHGYFKLWIPPRRANYERAATSEQLVTAPSVPSTVIQTNWPTHAQNMPIETITSMGIRARSRDSTLVTVFVRDVNLYIMIEADK